MSTYALSPTGTAAGSDGKTLVETGGTVAGGILADGSDSTYVSKWVNAKPDTAVTYFDLSTKTIPTNERVYALGVSGRVRTPTGYGSVLVFNGLSGAGAPEVYGDSWRTTSSGVVNLPAAADQAYVDGLTAKWTAKATNTTGGSSRSCSELVATVYTASVPVAPTVSSPSGTVTDTSRPTVEWTHKDRTQVSVTNKARSGTLATLTATNTFAAGQTVTVSGVDAALDGTWVVVGSTGSAFTYNTVASGTISSASASGIAWVGDDKPQTNAEVAVFTDAQYGAGGFDPSTSTAAWRGTSGTASVTVLTDLASDTYRAYVRTHSQAGNVDLVSPWAYSGFTVAVVGSAEPDLTATWDEPTNRVVVQVQGHVNMLSNNQATIEGSTFGWTSPTNCAISQQSTQAKSGTYSMRLRSTASGNMAVVAYLGDDDHKALQAVVVGQDYTAQAAFRAAASARSCRVDIEWLDASLSTLSTTTGTAGNDSTSAWTVRSVTGTAPASAAYARVKLNVLSTGGASEDHFVDEVALTPGALAAWSPGAFPFSGTGYRNAASLLLERSSDSGTTWTTVRPAVADSTDDHGVVLDPAVQSYEVSDYEAPRGAAVTYRATVYSTTVGAVASAAAEESVVTTSDGYWWLKAVDVPERNMALPWWAADGYQDSKDTLAETFNPPGGGSFVVAHPGTGWDTTATIRTGSADEMLDLRSVLSAGKLLVQSVEQDADGVLRQWYAVPAGSIDQSPISVRDDVWETSVRLVEVDVPAQ